MTPDLSYITGRERESSSSIIIGIMGETSVCPSLFFLCPEENGRGKPAKKG